MTEKMITTEISLRDDTRALVDGCAEVHSPTELDARLRAGKRLRVKFGIDPTGSELHLGHAVVLHKMQQFVEMGHDVILLIGDFTARIGDPSGRNDSRPLLTDEMIDANMQTYRAQAGKVLDLERVTVRWNSEWLAKLTLADLIRELSNVTVAQMLERNDFAKRYGDGTPISLHEFLYPVAQAIDAPISPVHTKPYAPVTTGDTPHAEPRPPLTAVPAPPASCRPATSRYSRIHRAGSAPPRYAANAVPAGASGRDRAGREVRRR